MTGDLRFNFVVPPALLVAIRIITNAGDVYDRWESRLRMSEDKLYLLYCFEGIEGDSLQHVEYQADQGIFAICSENTDPEFLKIKLEETNDEIEVF